MKTILGILIWGTVTSDGKHVNFDLDGRELPIASDYECVPGSHERFWHQEEVRYLFFKRTVLVPFSAVGYAPIGQ